MTIIVITEKYGQFYNNNTLNRTGILSRLSEKLMSDKVNTLSFVNRGKTQPPVRRCRCRGTGETGLLED